MWEDTTCWDFCPFGYDGSEGLCLPQEDSFTIYSFTFLPPEDDCQIWEYRHDSFLVRVYGGTKEKGGEVEEPFIFADRGAWFDGKYDMMTFELLKLPINVVFGFWTKVHGGGVLFSANRTHGDFND